jgi:hypothetical protein
MKAGLVQMIHALASLPSPDGVCVNGDEEVGSATSWQLIEESVDRALVGRRDDRCAQPGRDRWQPHAAHPLRVLARAT